MCENHDPTLDSVKILVVNAQLMHHRRWSLKLHDLLFFSLPDLLKKWCYLKSFFRMCIIEWPWKSKTKNSIKPHRLQSILGDFLLNYVPCKNFVYLKHCLGQKINENVIKTAPKPQKIHLVDPTIGSKWCVYISTIIGKSILGIFPKNSIYPFLLADTDSYDKLTDFLIFHKWN